MKVAAALARGCSVHEVQASGKNGGWIGLLGLCRTSSSTANVSWVEIWLVVRGDIACSTGPCVHVRYICE